MACGEAIAQIMTDIHGVIGSTHSAISPKPPFLTTPLTINAPYIYMISFFSPVCFYMSVSVWFVCLSALSICLLHVCFVSMSPCLSCLSVFYIYVCLVSLSVLSICLSDARGIGTNTTHAKSRRESPSQITRKEAQAIPAALQRNKADLFPYIPRISLSHYRIITLSNPSSTPARKAFTQPRCPGYVETYAITEACAVRFGLNVVGE